MRITGGRLAGRIIHVPKGALEIRPAMDRMRESVFAVLGSLENRSFLDLFSGSGIIGIEASSRGADPVVCVERDTAKMPILLSNVAICDRRIECKAIPVERFLIRVKDRFDVIFADPPFPYAYRRELLESMAKVAAPKALVLMHFPREDAMPAAIGGLTLVDSRSYGRSIVNFYRNDEQLLTNP
jgi:16S rRNA (guanine(966)-N(2))-methyltransferase RsmD